MNVWWRSANGVVAVFFVLSGYGIYNSLQQRLGQKGPTYKAILRFYFDRFTRIYPIYWLALLVTQGFRPEYQQLHMFSARTVGIYLAVPFIQAPGIFWFVTAIIQCYLIAPLLYLGLRRLLPDTALIVNFAAANVLIAATYVLIISNSFSPVAPPDRIPLMYRNLLLANLDLFALGMLIVPVIRKYGEKLKSHLLLLFSLALFLSAVYSTGGVRIFRESEVIMGLPFLLGCFGFCLLIINIDPRLPLKRSVAWLGNYSAAIYLFHIFFFNMLDYTGLISSNWARNALFSLLLLPLFVLACVVLETLVNRFRRRSRMPNYLPLLPELGSNWEKR